MNIAKFIRFNEMVRVVIDKLKKAVKGFIIGDVYGMLTL